MNSIAALNPFSFSTMTAIPQFQPGMAMERLGAMPITQTNSPMAQMLSIQDRMLTMMMQMMLNLMMNMPRSGGASLAGGQNSTSGVNPISSAGGTTPPSDSGPTGPGAQGALDKARSMIGLNEKSNTAEIQKVTGKSGINPATTPWCAAFAINILKDSGALDTSGLENPNYCPTIVSWAKKKGIFGERGSYTPKPGDAIMFDWGSDGTSDHIGIVEKVEGGKVTTIEGNSSDSVKRNSYDLSSSKIMGYVKVKG